MIEKMLFYKIKYQIWKKRLFIRLSLKNIPLHLATSFSKSDTFYRVEKHFSIGI